MGGAVCRLLGVCYGLTKGRGVEVKRRTGVRVNAWVDRWRVQDGLGGEDGSEPGGALFTR